jgi:hypothetical protein
MKFIRYISLTAVSVGLLFGSLSLMAEENSTHQFTPKDQIRFSPSTTDAFDFSGQKVTEVRLPDGTIMANHNGTMQSVTVARVAADGSIETLCTTSLGEAREFMAGGISQPKAEAVVPPVRTR